MTHKHLVFLSLFFCASLTAATEGIPSNEAEWSLIPKGRAARLAIADPREIGMGLQFGASQHIDAMIGNYFSLLSYGNEDAKWFLGLEGAGYFSMRQQGAKFPLEHTDGLLGLYVEGAHGPWQFQVRYTHLSAHMADGSTEPAIVYSREYVTAKVGYVYGDLWHAYASAIATVNSSPSVPTWALQTGASVFPDWRFSKIAPFAAFDLKWKQETNFNPCLNLQLGIALNHSYEPFRSFRIFYNFYTGSDPRGQFFLRRRVAHSLGVEMQI